MIPVEVMCHLQNTNVTSAQQIPIPKLKIENDNLLPGIRALVLWLYKYYTNKVKTPL